VLGNLTKLTTFGGFDDLSFIF